MSEEKKVQQEESAQPKEDEVEQQESVQTEEESQQPETDQSFETQEDKSSQESVDPTKYKKMKRQLRRERQELAQLRSEMEEIKGQLKTTSSKERANSLLKRAQEKLGLDETNSQNLIEFMREFIESNSSQTAPARDELTGAAASFKKKADTFMSSLDAEEQQEIAPYLNAVLVQEQQALQSQGDDPNEVYGYSPSYFYKKALKLQASKQASAGVDAAKNRNNRRNLAESESSNGVRASDPKSAKFEQEFKKLSHLPDHHPDKLVLYKKNPPLYIKLKNRVSS